MRKSISKLEGVIPEI